MGGCIGGEAAATWPLLRHCFGLGPFVVEGASRAAPTCGGVSPWVAIHIANLGRPRPTLARTRGAALLVGRLGCTTLARGHRVASVGCGVAAAGLEVAAAIEVDSVRRGVAGANCVVPNHRIAAGHGAITGQGAAAAVDGVGAHALLAKGAPLHRVRATHCERQAMPPEGDHRQVRPPASDSGQTTAGSCPAVRGHGMRRSASRSKATLQPPISGKGAAHIALGGTARTLDQEREPRQVSRPISRSGLKNTTHSRRGTATFGAVRRNLGSNTTTRRTAWERRRHSATIARRR